jgi:guanine nucleotide-binding protein G(I)/G(S)/G(T) subunit beta-1
MSLSIEECKKQIEDLSKKIEDKDESPLKDTAANHKLPAANVKLMNRRVLKGHFGKIYAMQWAEDSKMLVSAAQDGKLLIWNAFTTNKIYAIPLRTSWMMTCAYSPTGNLVACGGLDNVVSVYKLPPDEKKADKVHAELNHHEGYLSCARFIDDTAMISSSGDATCVLWDVEAKAPKAIFNDHNGDVMSVALWNATGVFVSGSCDSSCKMWDYRDRKRCVKTFTGHESDVNSVVMFPDGNAFASGSDDAHCRIWDLRAMCQLNKLNVDKVVTTVTSLAFSSSGRILFAGHDDFTVNAWDTQLGTLVSQLGTPHDNRVSCLGVPKDGKALCTGSWDMLLKVWA